MSDSNLAQECDLLSLTLSEADVDTSQEVEGTGLFFGTPLKNISRKSQALVIMHLLKEELHQIFESNKELGSGIMALLDWLKKAEPYYKKSVQTIKRWFGEVVGYFERRTTNGIVEGINNKLKLLKRCGFAFRNFMNPEIRALLFWHFPKDLAY